MSQHRSVSVANIVMLRKLFNNDGRVVGTFRDLQGIAKVKHREVILWVRRLAYYVYEERRFFENIQIN